MSILAFSRPISNRGSATCSTQPTRVFPSISARCSVPSPSARRRAPPGSPGDRTSANSVVPARTGPAWAASMTRPERGATRAVVGPGSAGSNRPSSPRARTALPGATGASRNPSAGARTRSERAGRRDGVRRPSGAARPSGGGRTPSPGQKGPRRDDQRLGGVGVRGGAGRRQLDRHHLGRGRRRQQAARGEGRRQQRRGSAPQRQPVDPRILEVSPGDDHAAPAPPRPSEHDERLRPHDQIGEEDEGIARQPFSVGGAGKRQPERLAPQRSGAAAGTQHGDDHHAPGQGGGVQAGGQPIGGAGGGRLAAPDRRHDADPRPRLASDDHPGGDRSVGPRGVSARARRQRDPHRACLARRDRYAPHPDTTRWQLYRHRMTPEPRTSRPRGHRGGCTAASIVIARRRTARQTAHMWVRGNDL